MEQVQQNNQYQVLATTSLTEEKTFVLKHNHTFANINRYGDIMNFEGSSQGIYYQGTRYLSGYRMTIEGSKPLFLSSNMKERNEKFLVDLTNPDIMEDGQVRMGKDVVHIRRKKILWENVFYEQVLIHNFSQETIEFRIDIEYDADFSDLFEIRGTGRSKRGIRLPAQVNRSQVRLRYSGLDNVERSTTVKMKPEPSHLDEERAVFQIRLKPGESYVISPTVVFENSEDEKSRIYTYRSVSKKHKRVQEYIDSISSRITTSNEQFNHWINRSRIDLITMISQTEHGPYPFAGIPWYDTPFGRDGIITALECLWLNPEVGEGVLRYLAATQATDENSFSDAEPGKILHEARDGEMALLNEIPFRQYYGTIDATPLFIVLAGAWYQRTGNLEVIRELWPHIELALEWIDKYGDTDGDMFVEYARKEESGLFNQGWKDSHDSISYSDGRIAELPLALCEVQGYVYDAWLKASVLAKALDKKTLSDNLVMRAEKLKEKFTNEFWSQDKSTFYLALAKDKQPCNVVASNAGHCLFSGIATYEQAHLVSKVLLQDHMYSGWGIRTLSSREIRYNPISYHNGSIWPHDNAMIAYGFSKYGLKDEVIKITKALFDVSRFNDGARLPELFCGFKRKQGEAPTSYPVACSPQSWSVASVFMLIQAMLGMEINEQENIIRFYRPVLPDFIEKMNIKNLQFKKLKISLEFIRTGDTISIQLMNRDVPVKLEVTW